jgi:ankyrin repeat protein
MAKKKYYERPDIIEAVINNDINKVKRLINLGCDIDIQDRDGWTALHFAAHENNFAITKMLLDNGAAVDLKEIYGNTALFKAVFSSRGNGDIIKLLLDHGADRNLKNNYGVSPYDLAHLIANYPVAQFLEITD